VEENCRAWSIVIMGLSVLMMILRSGLATVGFVGFVALNAVSESFEWFGNAVRTVWPSAT
jgi:hypothetical protein